MDVCTCLLMGMQMQWAERARRMHRCHSTAEMAVQSAVRAVLTSAADFAPISEGRTGTKSRLAASVWTSCALLHVRVLCHVQHRVVSVDTNCGTHVGSSR